jgi:hypothetical protein
VKALRAGFHIEQRGSHFVRAGIVGTGAGSENQQ